MGKKPGNSRSRALGSCGNSFRGIRWLLSNVVRKLKEIGYSGSAGGLIMKKNN